MSNLALFVLQVLFFSASYTQETRSWRMADNPREMNTTWNQWGPVHHDVPKKETDVKIRPEEHCKKSPVKIKEYPFFVRVQSKCYEDSQKAIWAGENRHYCVLTKADEVTCRYSKTLPGDFCDATAELVAVGSIHKIELGRTDENGYNYYKLNKPIEDSSKAKPARMYNNPGDYTVPAVLMTLMPTVGEKYGLVYTENITYTKSDTCTGWGDVSRSKCDTSDYWCKFRKTKCLSRYDFMIVLVQGELAGIKPAKEECDPAPKV